MAQCGRAVQPHRRQEPSLHSLWFRGLAGGPTALLGCPRPLLVVEAGERARALPVHGRRVPVQARQRGPGAHVRRRGRPCAHQPALPSPGQWPAFHAAVDRLRLGHPLRMRPRPAARRLRQGRNIGCIRGDPRRHEGSLRRFRSRVTDHIGVDDDQRPGAGDPGDVLQHGHRPGLREGRCRRTSSR